MRCFTLVVDPEGPAARAVTARLAARGKDLLLVGASRASLDLVASELRVARRVDVRVLEVDPGQPGGAARILRWIDRTELPVDRVVSALSDEVDEARRARVEVEVTELAAALTRREGARLVGGTLWRNESGRAAPRSTRPPSAAPRSRASTAPGHGDPQ